MNEEQLRELIEFCTEKAEMARKDANEMLALTYGNPNLNFTLAQGREEAFQAVLAKIKEMAI